LKWIYWEGYFEFVKTGAFLVEMKKKEKNLTKKDKTLWLNPIRSIWKRSSASCNRRIQITMRGWCDGHSEHPKGVIILSKNPCGFFFVNQVQGTLKVFLFSNIYNNRRITNSI